MDFSEAHWPCPRLAVRVKAHCVRDYFSVRQGAPIFWRREDLRLSPRGRRKVWVADGPLNGVRLNPDLHLRQAGKADLRVASDRDDLAGFDLRGTEIVA